MTFIRVHSKTNLSPPLISFASLSSFPPGEAKAAAPQRVAKLATPTRRGESHWLVATNGVHSLREGAKALRASGRLRASPTGAMGAKAAQKRFLCSSNFSSPKEDYI